MADLGPLGPAVSGSAPEMRAGGMFSALAMAQYDALIRFRWRMFSNSLRSSKGMVELGARTFSYVVYAVIGLAFASGAGVGTYFLAADSEWRFLPILFWVLAFVWQMIPVMLASFQEQFDLGILLRFPVSFGSYMLLYLAFGLLDISTILGGLCCVGIWGGIAAARPDLLLWTTIALAAFALFNVLLARAVFAWIERWLAQRKTREILGAVFMLALLSLQLLNPAFYQRRHSGRSGHEVQADKLREMKARYGPLLKQAEAVQKWLPPGLAAQALSEPAQQQAVEGLSSLGILALYMLVAGGALAWRLKGEYRGENLGAAPRRASASTARGKSAAGLAARTMHADASSAPAGSSGAIAAIIEKDVRALLRTLPLLWAIGAPLIMVLVFAGVFIRNGGSGLRFTLALPLCMVYAQLGFTQVFYNNLGTEGAGVQLYFLSPTPFRTVMLAKNLLHSVLFAVVAAVAAAMATMRLGASDDAVQAATAAWLLFTLPCNLAIGNLFSLKMPYRVNPGRISRQRGSQGNALMSLLAQICFLILSAAVFALCWYLDRMWLATPVFLLLSGIAWLVWWRVLDGADALAAERRTELMTTLMKES